MFLLRQAAVDLAIVAALSCGNADRGDGMEQLASERSPSSEVTMQHEAAPSEPSRSRTANDSLAEQEARAQMVDEQIAGRDVTDQRVLAALREVPRHEFVPSGMRRLAYEDFPLPIGEQQTISQPYIVGIMTQLLRPAPGDRVLEIGTGSGYQAAVLGELVREVYTIEIVDPLARRAEETLSRLGYDNVHVRSGDGYQGWPSKAPFDGIIVTAAAPSVPKPLLEQLGVGARLVIPVGDHYQELRVITRTEHGFEERSELPVRFVPMTGQARGD
jgi:protein-L-isoaspartate(D-aspartate) O-methyltransferase